MKVYSFEKLDVWQKSRKLVARFEAAFLQLLCSSDWVSGVKVLDEFSSRSSYKVLVEAMN